MHRRRSSRWLPPPSCPLQRLETCEQLAHRLAAMRQRILARKRQFGACQTRDVVLEMRVVAEAAAAARRIDDRSMPDAFGDDRLGIGGVPDEDEHAVIVRTP